MASIETSTLIYINNVTTGSATGKVANVDEIGFYSFDGTLWQKFGSGADVNIYKDNGTLMSNRLITMNDKTLSFNSNATTGTSHFNIDGSTLSVDAVNNRVGIGTNTPGNLLEINNGTTNGAIKIVDGTQQDGRVLTSDTNGVGTWKALSSGNKTTIWNLSGSRNYSTTTLTLVTGTGSFIGANEVGATLGTNSLTLPSGKYLVFINFDGIGGEYGNFQVRDGGTEIYYTIYGEWLNSSFLYESSSPINLQLYFQGRIGSGNPAPSYFLSNYNGLTMRSTITILKLN